LGRLIAERIKQENVPIGKEESMDKRREDIVKDQMPDDNRAVFPSVHDLADYLEVSERRIRQYKQSGRLNYITSAVLVDPDELRAIKKSQAAYSAPYVQVEQKKPSAEEFARRSEEEFTRRPET
jgi:hypothetical protein